jgi:hypothetical protein
MNELTNDDVEGVLKARARDLGGAQGWDPTYGHGLVRADSALKVISPPNAIVKSQVSPVRIDSVGILDSQEFMNIPCVTLWRVEEPETLSAHIYEMVGYASFTDSAHAVWTRGRQTNGWRDITGWGWRITREEELVVLYDGLLYGNWAEVIDGTVTAEGCSLRSYTYKFFRDGDFAGWTPVDGTTGYTTCTTNPKPASLAYTYVIGGGGGGRLTGGSPALQVRIQGPSPSTPMYRFTWSLPEREMVEAAIFDVGGRLVRVLFSGSVGPGEVRLTWNRRDSAGRETPAGIYFLKVKAGNLAQTSKLLALPKGGDAR